ncbi:MAG: WG repeat-containing protein [Microscillaceae bacterium]|nr:WG repeat-containing protein [Microscillaceae bacterium]
MPYRLGNTWGFSDARGKMVIKPQFEEARFSSPIWLRSKSTGIGG